MNFFIKISAQMGGIPFTVGGPNGPNGGAVQNDPANLHSLNATDTANSTLTTTTTTTTKKPDTQNDDVEGSGDDEDGANREDDDLTSLLDLGSFITRAALFRRSIRSVDPKPNKNERKSRQFYSTCNDRITLPCIVEDFISVGGGSIPTCSPIHCGNSLCSNPNVAPCRVESTVTPFNIGVYFGDGFYKGIAEENIGACIRYKQLKCA